MNFEKTVQDLMKKEAELEARRERARAFALEEINATIRLLDIKPADLDFSGRQAAARRGSVRRTGRSSGKVAPKYRTPEGATWTGRGKQPAAIRGALARGLTLEAMTIRADGTTAAEASSQA